MYSYRNVAEQYCESIKYLNLVLRVGDFLLVNGHRLREELVGDVLFGVETCRAQLVDYQKA